MWNRVDFPDWNGWIEILFLAVLFYYLFLFLKGTRGATMLTGLVVLFIGLIAAVRIFELNALNWLLGSFSGYLVVSLLIIFQAEIRRALAELGKRHLFGLAYNNQTLVDQLTEAALRLSRRRIGALMAIERSIGTRFIQETGIKVDGAVTPELLAALFEPGAPLHDGGVVIAGNRIAAAGCMFPLSEREQLGTELGTRHRAALGLSDETDAIVVVVSEETGVISVCRDGRLIRGFDEERLRRKLAEWLLPPRRGEAGRPRAWRRLGAEILRRWRGAGRTAG